MAFSMVSKEEATDSERHLMVQLQYTVLASSV